MKHSNEDLAELNANCQPKVLTSVCVTPLRGTNLVAKYLVDGFGCCLDPTAQNTPESINVLCAAPDPNPPAPLDEVAHIVDKRRLLPTTIGELLRSMDNKVVLGTLYAGEVGLGRISVDDDGLVLEILGAKAKPLLLGNWTWAWCS